MSSALVQIRPKKLSPELRKPRPRYRDEKRWTRRWLLRLREDPRAVRLAVQLGFVGLCIWIGVEFSRLDHPTYQHARGQVPAYTPND